MPFSKIEMKSKSRNSSVKKEWPRLIYYLNNTLVCSMTFLATDIHDFVS